MAKREREQKKAAKRRAKQEKILERRARKNEASAPLDDEAEATESPAPDSEGA